VTIVPAASPKNAVAIPLKVSPAHPMEHFPEQACPGLEPGAETVIRRKCNRIKKIERVSD
jgi:hypothetical protein